VPRRTELKQRWEEGKRNLRASTPRAIAEGLEHVQKIAKEEVRPYTHKYKQHVSCVFTSYI
jgi:hypothetical protein